MAVNPDIMEPMEHLSLGSEEVQVCTGVNYYEEKIADSKIENVMDEAIAEEYKQMSSVQKQKFNQLV